MLLVRRKDECENLLWLCGTCKENSYPLCQGILVCRWSCAQLRGVSVAEVYNAIPLKLHASVTTIPGRKGVRPQAGKTKPSTDEGIWTLYTLYVIWRKLLLTCSTLNRVFKVRSSISQDVQEIIFHIWRANTLWRTSIKHYPKKKVYMSLVFWPPQNKILRLSVPFVSVLHFFCRVSPAPTPGNVQSRVFTKHLPFLNSLIHIALWRTDTLRIKRIVPHPADLTSFATSCSLEILRSLAVYGSISESTFTETFNAQWCLGSSVAPNFEESVYIVNLFLVPLTVGHIAY